MHDDDPVVDCSILPFRLGTWDTGPADPDVQLDAANEIIEQLFNFVRLALKNKSDPWQAIRIIARAERLLGEYIAVGFDQLEPLQRQLHDGLYRAFRISRRVFIMRAL